MPIWAAVMGVFASLICYTAVQLKGRFGYDDSLDAFGVHGVGGMFGALATGVFCSIPVKGLIYGDVTQLGKQFLGVAVTVVFAFVGTLVIGGAIKATIGLRVSEREEEEGLDLTVHGEQGYHLDL
jgi:Amt family ammonium transporter